MKFEFLNYFSVLAEELHFGRAAARLSITQPPLSAAIKTLESEVGVLLFRRTRTFVRLTAAGAAFHEEARRILDGYAHAKIVARDVDKGITGRLDVGFGVTLAFRGVMRVVQSFRAVEPRIDLVLHEVPAAGQFEKLARGQLDAGFIVAPLAPSELSSLSLKDDPLVVCMPEGHSVANCAAVDLRRLANEEFLMFTRETGSVHYDNVLSVLTRAGVYPKFSIHTRGWISMVVLISQGHGMGLVPASLSQMNLPGVRFVPLQGPPTTVPAMLAWKPENLNPALARFLEIVTPLIGAPHEPS